MRRNTAVSHSGSSATSATSTVLAASGAASSSFASISTTPYPSFCPPLPCNPFEFATFVGILKRLDILGHTAHECAAIGFRVIGVEHIAASGAVVGLHGGPPLLPG